MFGSGSGLRFFVVLILLSQALFWGLFEHSQHCSVAAALGVRACAPHWVHLLMGVVFFAATVAAAHWPYLTAPRKA